MRELPDSEVYEKEFRYFPWGVLIKRVIPKIIKNAGKNARVLDLMCGPGYLLGKIKKKRKDLQLTGIDIDKRFIEYSKKKYKNIRFICADATEYKFNEKFDLIIITAGFHHVSYDKQESFIKNVFNLLDMGGKVIIADPFIRDYKDEKQRKKAAAELGYNYIISTLDNNPPKEIIDASIDIMFDDINKSEYKTSKDRMEHIFKKYFSILKFVKTWPNLKSKYGEGYWILKK